MRYSRPVFKVGLAIIVVAVLLVGAEAAYRYRNSGRGAQLRYYRHARLERALVRDIDYNGVVHINRHGFRGRDFNAAKSPGTIRIITVGASTTFDPCAPTDSATWPARLEHWLEQLLPGQRFEVLNAGVPGMPMLDHLIRLESEFHAFAPDIYVVYANHGIVSAADAPNRAAVNSDTPDAAPTVTPWDVWLREHSRLYERFRPAARPASAPSLTDMQWATAVTNASRNFERDLTNFAAVAHASGAKVVFAEIHRATGDRPASTFQPAERAAWQRLSATPPEVVHTGYERFRGVWQTVADRTGATFVNASSIGITGVGNFCTGDPIHFSAAGSDLMGKGLAEQVVSRVLRD